MTENEQQDKTTTPSPAGTSRSRKSRGRTRGGGRGRRHGRQDREKYFRLLPAVDELVNALDSILSSRERALPRPLITEAARETVEETRQKIALAKPESLPELDLSVETLARQAHARLEVKSRRSLSRVVNATGVVLHTNFGRALLAKEARDAAAEVASAYVNLEFDVAAGQRGSRLTHVEALLAKLTGAEAAIAVNNNAAALLLILDTFAKGGEVLVSRGQLVEIGGSFRLPDIMAKSGCRLVEVGTTNKTYLADYEAGVGPGTSLLLRVHTSNFKVVGFTADVDITEMAALGRRFNLPVVDDLGSGCLVDLSAYGLPPEPTPQASVAAGADLVTFSGDKLLGGPQAGIVVGRRKLVDALKGNPLMRALRLDKMALAALEATLRLYAEGGAPSRVPVLAMLTTHPNVLEENARTLAAAIRKALTGLTKKGEVTIDVVEGFSPAGGGALPGVELPARLVSVKTSRYSASVLEERLRLAQPPVLARIRDEHVLLDPRTILGGEEEDVAAAFKTAFGRGERGA
jgi:L-seryl-tRNA(Ser) seleniumtransferase